MFRGRGGRRFGSRGRSFSHISGRGHEHRRQGKGNNLNKERKNECNGTPTRKSEELGNNFIPESKVESSSAQGSFVNRTDSDKRTFLNKDSSVHKDSSVDKESKININIEHSRDRKNDRKMNGQVRNLVEGKYRQNNKEHSLNSDILNDSVEERKEPIHRGVSRGGTPRLTRSNPPGKETRLEDKLAKDTGKYETSRTGFMKAESQSERKQSGSLKTNITEGLRKNQDTITKILSAKKGVCQSDKERISRSDDLSGASANFNRGIGSNRSKNHGRGRGLNRGRRGRGIQRAIHFAGRHSIETEMQGTVFTNEITNRRNNSGAVNAFADEDGIGTPKLSQSVKIRYREQNNEINSNSNVTYKPDVKNVESKIEDGVKHRAIPVKQNVAEEDFVTDTEDEGVYQSASKCNKQQTEDRHRDLKTSFGNRGKGKTNKQGIASKQSITKIIKTIGNRSGQFKDGNGYHTDGCTPVRSNIEDRKSKAIPVRQNVLGEDFVTDTEDEEVYQSSNKCNKQQTKGRRRDIRTPFSNRGEAKANKQGTASTQSLTQVIKTVGVQGESCKDENRYHAHRCTHVRLKTGDGVNKGRGRCAERCNIKKRKIQNNISRRIEDSFNKVGQGSAHVRGGRGRGRVPERKQGRPALNTGIHTNQLPTDSLHRDKLGCGEDDIEYWIPSQFKQHSDAKLYQFQRPGYCNVSQQKDSVNWKKNTPMQNICVPNGSAKPTNVMNGKTKFKCDEHERSQILQVTQKPTENRQVKNSKSRHSRTEANKTAWEPGTFKQTRDNFVTRANLNKCFNESELKELCTKTQEEVSEVFGLNIERLQKSLRKGKEDETLFGRLLQLVSKALSSRDMDMYERDIVIALQQLSFFDICAHHIARMIADTSTDEVDMLTTFEQIASVIKVHLTLSPRVAVSVIGIKDLMKNSLDQLSPETASYGGVMESMNELEDMLEEILKPRRESLFALSSQSTDDLKPPDHFRDIDVYPTQTDITTLDKPFLRSNKKSGKFDDVDHYLDVQFRLLREDFLGPLREGIQDYRKQLAQSGKRKVQSIRLYQTVKILETKCERDGLVHCISFDTKPFKRINWAHSKRMIYGSLLCLSSNSFDTVLFATVANRDLRELEKGKIQVSFLHSLKDIFELKEHTFVMAESVAFFEAYRHVLKGLQEIDILPFEKYIVSCKSEVDPPAYVAEGRGKMDLRPLIDTEYKIRNRRNLPGRARRYEEKKFSANVSCAKEVKIMDRSQWPNAQDLHLDSSQFQAIQTALTKEFVVTQGPPGTGKTYIGLQIVKALLHNRKLWSPEEDSRPMLIVCYTNHALDQFIEGIANFYDGDIIRVGSRSSSEALEEFNLNTIRGKCRYNPNIIPGDVSEEIDIARSALSTATERVERALQQIIALKNRWGNCIVSEYYLEQVMGDSACDSLENGIMDVLSSRPDLVETMFTAGIIVSFIAEWLGCGQLLDKYNFICLKSPFSDMGEKEEPETSAGVGDKRDEGNENDDSLVDVYDVGNFIQDERLIEDFDDWQEDFTSTNLGHKPVFPMEDSLDTEHIFDEDVSAMPLFSDTDGYEEEYVGIGSLLEKEEEMPFTTTEDGTKDVFQTTETMEWDIWKVSKDDRKRRKQEQNKHITESNAMTEEEAREVRDVWTLNHEQRWRLYRYWLILLLKQLEDQKMRYEGQYMDCMIAYKEAKKQEDKCILSKASVLGMTTTGAARYLSVLQEIGPRIVVVEEAAEVLEAHIITSLSSQCQHLILIGDHKQLRPSPTMYRLVTDFHLDISLFERMLNNGVSCDCLALQHRMRPEISLLMRHIYPHLQDHESVTQYDEIKGVASSVFFIKHSNAEKQDPDQKSHSNIHEASYLAALCDYLLKQGYEPSQITVLTTYSAQLFALRNTMPKEKFAGVKVTVVDNFQGEENDIILLSLVRSNAEGRIGFMKIENRICVAMSRAKKGFYVIGNFNFLSRHSDLWKKIVETLEEKKQIGNALTLYCQNHQDTKFEAKIAEDFEQSPNGGCKRHCDARLDCGHKCARLCHPDDSRHSKYQCQKQCPNTCPNGHKCKKKCSETCGKCYILVEKVIPKCKHRQMIHCYMDPEEFQCKEPCEADHGCQHECKRKCGDHHVCEEIVSKALPKCSHEIMLPCHQHPDKVICQKPCSQTLPCQHPCDRICGDESHTERCEVIVTKTLPRCGHKPNTKCFQMAEEIICKQPCVDTLLCGHTCDRRCGDESHTKRCEVLVKKDLQKCGHSITIPCFKKAEGKECKEPCSYVLPCKHPCDRTCGDDNHTRICKVIVTKELPKCGHEVKIPCFRKADDILCDKKCEKTLLCGHCCINLCHMPHTTKCKKPVKRVCQDCGREQEISCYMSEQFRCSYPCKTVLKCGHRCVNKCGDAHTDKCLERRTKRFECGHNKLVSCHGFDTAVCKESCSQRLACGHVCRGTCTECCRYKMHVQCQERCNELLVCGHQCGGPCSTCFLCKEPCPFRCPHIVCKKYCSETCDVLSCREPCTWSCDHFRCSLKCSEVCDRPPCNEPCPRILLCKHRCIGLCGEKCPSYCRKCDKGVVEKMVCRRRGRRREPRFIQLPCRHLIEVNFLDLWVQGTCGKADSSAHRMPRCPRCKVPFHTVQRYQRYIKMAAQAVEKIKRQTNMDSASNTVADFQTTNAGNRFVLEDLLDYIQKKLPNISKSEFFTHIESDVAKFSGWFEKKRKHVTLQERVDSREEAKRLYLLVQLFVFEQANLKDRDTKSCADNVLDIANQYKEHLMKGFRLDEKWQKQIEDYLSSKRKLVLYHGLNVDTDCGEDKAARLFAQKSWRICKTGHVWYVDGRTKIDACLECEKEKKSSW